MSTASVRVAMLLLASVFLAACAPAGDGGEPGVVAVGAGPGVMPQVPPPPGKPKESPFDPQDLGLLDAEDRDQWQRPDQIMDALKIAEGSVVADLGAGGGWFTMRLARRVEQDKGIVYAEDIQTLMLDALNRRALREGLRNVVPVKGEANDPKLPPGIDAALIVDAYHEMEVPSDPSQVVTLLSNIAKSLKPQGCLGIVDFEAGSAGPGPDPDERPDPESIVRSATAAGLTLLKREAVPPFQFLLVFGKAGSVSRCAS